MPYKPPVCPECGEPISVVDEVVSETYRFDEATGTFKLREIATTVEIECLVCKADLLELLEAFEHGVCNYVAE